jgi:hypothetical protein
MGWEDRRHHGGCCPIPCDKKVLVVVNDSVAAGVECGMDAEESGWRLASLCQCRRYLTGETDEAEQRYMAHR